MENHYKNHSTDALYKELDVIKIGDSRQQEIKREINNRIGRFSIFPENSKHKKI